MASPVTSPTALIPVASTNSNPLAGGPWGVYTNKYDDVYGPYLKATGTDKALLAKIALRPRVRWFGEWTPTSDIASKIRSYVSVSQHGNPDTLVQFATFRLWPNGGEAGRNRPMSAAQLNDYKAWYRAVAGAIGTARVAVVLEPDLAMARKGWQPSTRFALTKYAAYVLSRQPRTSVYIDASDADWLKVPDAVAMLKASGITYARGFALGATHYWAVSSETTYARSVIASLNAAHITNKHAVIDTADNGKPFTWGQYWKEHPKGDFDNAETCRSTTDTTCDTLGHPPTWLTTDPAHVDGYLWFGRPWLVRQASPFSLTRALQVARTTPFK
ncbi:MAG: glycoside hydrolase family 6 protein [Marmoricola sp.]|nr:glycoside hydrolase family 6 protein [Marmoricola sp.]